MKRIIVSTLLVVTPALASAQESNPPVAVTGAPPLLLTIVVLALACACAVFCFQVLTLLRGGQLSRSWTLFTAGFAVLALSQFAVLLNGFGVIPSTRYIVPALLILMSGLFIYGLYDTKRVLG
jgi:hypothetical protein